MPSVRKIFIPGFFVLLLCNACGRFQARPAVSRSDIPVAWAAMLLYLTKNTPANSPTFASRAFGYIGVTMYESVVHSDPAYVSIAPQLNGLGALALPQKGQPYNWALALNAGQAAILRSIYIQTSHSNKQRIDSLENALYHAFADTAADVEVTRRSVAFGKAVAARIFEWSTTDGGHRGYLFNFDANMTYPNRQGSWKPPYFAQQITRLPLHPHWGDNRTLLVADADWQIPAFIPYDTTDPSDCYRQFAEVYQANKKITPEQKEIALWWNDDPSETYTPPGHSYNLALTVVKATHPGMVKAAETFARTGLAVADAFIVCWRMKYHFFSLRPSTYVSEHIDAEWEPFWPDPPFPSFPSGHATQAGAVATVLSGIYGRNLSFTDSSHANRPRDARRNVDYKPRHFQSFWQVAEETAKSRFYGGIHTMQDNETGLQEGREIGEHINALRWKN